MQTKLTLRLDDELIDQAKNYAARSGKSVSQVVADYFRLLPAGNEPAAPPETAPLTCSLRGLLRGTRLDEADYRRHLEEKNR
ncbi:MAG: DUF6364 family protein [Trichloromonas sp.]|nr:DUF6364 family protein [Trichloromonas sp.]